MIFKILAVLVCPYLLWLLISVLARKLATVTQMGSIRIGRLRVRFVQHVMRR